LAESGGSAGDVVAVATVGEEVGDFLGARAASFALEPAVAVAVDVTWASDVPGGDPKEYGEQKLGDGAAISRGPGISPKLFELLMETAEAEGIEHRIEVSQAAHTRMRTRSSSAVRACPPAWSRSRCGTCTRPARSAT
jgi:endoglucanase